MILDLDFGLHQILDLTLESESYNPHFSAIQNLQLSKIQNRKVLPGR